MMPDLPPVTGMNQQLLLERVMAALSGQGWVEEVYLRGSLPRTGGDQYSDVDIAVTIQDEAFTTGCMQVLTAVQEQLRPLLPGWLDTLVRDFGGIGLVYFVSCLPDVVQLDLYVLPASVSSGFVVYEAPVLVDRRAPRSEPARSGPPSMDRDQVRRAVTEEPLSSVLRCYVAAYLLHKRIRRGNQVMIFAETYGLAEAVRDYIVGCCYPNRREHGWHNLEEVVSRSPDPAQCQRALLRLASCQPGDSVLRLAEQLVELEALIRILTPDVWDRHGPGLSVLSEYIAAGVRGST
jgi:predicted nucleotidyltransferase